MTRFLTVATLLASLAAIGCMSTSNDMGRGRVQITVPPGVALPAASAGKGMVFVGCVFNVQSGVTTGNSKPIQAGIDAQTGIGDTAMRIAADALLAGAGGSVAGLPGAAGGLVVGEAIEAYKQSQDAPTEPVLSAAGTPLVIEDTPAPTTVPRVTPPVAAPPVPVPPKPAQVSGDGTWYVCAVCRGVAKDGAGKPCPNCDGKGWLAAPNEPTVK